MQENDKRIMSWEEREQEERNRFTKHKPLEPKVKEERKEKESND
jgi:hypothetical protein